MRLLAVALTAVLILVSLVGIVGGFALLARRLLGLQFGLVRLLLAGLVGSRSRGRSPRRWPAPVGASAIRTRLGSYAPVMGAIAAASALAAITMLLAHRARQRTMPTAHT